MFSSLEAWRVKSMTNSWWINVRKANFQMTNAAPPQLNLQISHTIHGTKGIFTYLNLNSWSFGYSYICKYTSSHGWYGWWFRNPTPVDMVNIPIFTGFYTSQGGFYRIWWISEPSMGFLPLTQPASWQTINMKTKAVLEDERRAAVKRKATKRMSTYKEGNIFPAPFLKNCYCTKDPGVDGKQKIIFQLSFRFTPQKINGWNVRIHPNW